MRCKICGKPVVLIPSAKKRADKYGGKPSDYTALFTSHSECALAERAKGTSELIKRLNKEQS